MRTTSHRSKLIPLFLLMICSGAAAQTITATIDANKVGPPISPYLYGQFLEHLSNTVNTGIWAEMLDDRKFYATITSRPATTPARGRGFVRRWMPVGPDDSVVMDTNNPFVGDHSPMIKLDATGPRGIRQAAISIRKGKSYTGQIWLSGDSTAKVTVSLIWGSGMNDQQTINIPALSADYAQFPLNFTAGDDSDAARIEISGTGSGTFHIGTITLMPGDNVQGFRKEVVDCLAQLHSGVYRFPGGNYISNYEWRDAVGPRDKRRPDWDFAWNAIQPNDVGLDEFMVLFKLIGVDPYITINAGFGDEYSAAQLVEYANGSAETPMGKLRAANGHAEPYGIKLWGIGNEMYGDWQLGVMPPDQYQTKHNIFAAAMKRVDPSIKLVASGAMPDEMTTTLQGKRLDGQVLTEIGSRGDWTGGLLNRCLPNIDIISEHAYCNAGQVFDIASGKYVNVPNDTLADWVRRPANRAQAKYEAFEEYLKRYPGMASRHITISLDEFSVRNTQGGNYRSAMAYAYQLDEFFRHTDVFQMAAFTFATACMTSTRTDAVLNPAGEMFKLYRDHFGTLPVDMSGNSPQPAPKYPIGGDQPKTNAGSDTFPLDVSAAFTDDHKTLAIAVINASETAQQLGVTIHGVDLAGTGHLWRLAPASLNAVNLVGQAPGVAIQDQDFNQSPSTLALAPFSINIFDLAVK